MGILYADCVCMLINVYYIFHEICHTIYSSRNQYMYYYIYLYELCSRKLLQVSFLMVDSASIWWCFVTHECRRDPMIGGVFSWHPTCACWAGWGSWRWSRLVWSRILEPSPGYSFSCRINRMNHTIPAVSGWIPLVECISCFRLVC